MYQMIYRISINLYRYEYRIEKTDRYPALMFTVDVKQHNNNNCIIWIPYHIETQTAPLKENYGNFISYWSVYVSHFFEYLW